MRKRNEMQTAGQGKTLGTTECKLHKKEASHSGTMDL